MPIARCRGGDWFRELAAEFALSAHQPGLPLNPVQFVPHNATDFCHIRKRLNRDSNHTFSRDGRVQMDVSEHWLQGEPEPCHDRTLFCTAENPLPSMVPAAWVFIATIPIPLLAALSTVERIAGRAP